jgi:acyl-CoA thioesterase-1
MWGIFSIEDLGVRRCVVTLAVAAVLVAAMAIETEAAHVNIVTLGGSNTAGNGVDRAAAYPAQLESLLRARGYDVSVKNEGVSGAESTGILSSLDSAVPDGTGVVILHTSRRNALHRGISPQQRLADIAAIRARLQARHIRVIYIRDIYEGVPQGERQVDGVHLTEAGHAAVARRLLPQVVSALGGRE